VKRERAARRGRGRSGDAAPLLRTPFSESYRDVMELAPIGIFTSTLEGRFLAANAALVEMLGYESVEEVLGIDIPGDLYFDPDERARVLSQYEQGSGIVRVETVLKRKDGSPVSVRLDSRVVRDAEGRTLGFEGFAHDITERKRAEEELRRSEERFRALVENSSEVIGLFDREGHWLYASPSVERLWGYSAEEMEPFRRFGERAHPDDIVAMREKFRSLVERPDGIETMEFRGRHKDGSWRVFEAVGANRLETPGVGAIVANLRDITPRKEAENALKESAERFRTLIERAPVAIGMDRNGKTIYANAAYQQMYGFRSTEELRGRPIVEQWAPQCRPEIEERIRQRGLGQLVATEYEGLGQRKDGSQFPVHAAATIVQLEDGPATIAFLTDITESKRAEEALRASERRYRHLFENNLAGVFRSTPEGRMIDTNEAFARILGCSSVADVKARNARTFYFDADERERALAILRERGALTNLEARLRRADGSVAWVLENVSLVASDDGPVIEGTVIDVTERKLGEERLRRSYEELRALAARMESVREEESSRIARELHDEIGQALTAIKIHLQTLQRRTDAPATAAELSESIGMSERALEQVRNLSLDLRPSVLDDLGLAAALRWYLDRQARLSGFAAEFSADLPPDRVPRELETACFRVAQQALTNVAQHARARRVSVELRREEADLSLSIRDDGVGFDVAAARALARGGRSLGILGMEERVLLLGGAFEVRSVPSGGTEVRASFPLTPPQPAGRP
jgi:PAS domain S-box-containing protein